MEATITGTKRARRTMGGIALGVFSVWTLSPFYWMIVTSLKKHDEIYGTTATLYPHAPTLESYYILFFKTEYMIWFRNSMRHRIDAGTDVIQDTSLVPGIFSQACTMLGLSVHIL